MNATIETIALIFAVAFVAVFTLGAAFKALGQRRATICYNAEAEHVAQAFTDALASTEWVLYSSFPDSLLLEYYSRSLDNIAKAQASAKPVEFATALGEMILMQAEITSRFVVLLDKIERQKL